MRHCDSVERSKHKEFLLFEEIINLNKLLTGHKIWSYKENVPWKYKEFKSLLLKCFLLSIYRYNVLTCTSYNVPNGKTGKFTKMIFYFLKSEMCTCKVKVTGKRTNFGDDKGLRIPVRFNSLDRRRVLNFWRNWLKSVDSHQYWNLSFGPPTFGRKGSYKITPVVS